METVSVLGYEWCIWSKEISDELDYEFIQTLSGDWLVYCRRESYRSDSGNTGGVRVVPVSRHDIEII
jgi:hypothetical protein